MPKVEIDIDQVLMCAVALSASPGDRLLILGGVVVGILPPPDIPEIEVILPEDDPAKRRQAILAVIRREGPVTADQIAARVGFNVGRDMAMLRRAEAVEVTGKGRFPTYRVRPHPINGTGPDARE